MTQAQTFIDSRLEAARPVLAKHFAAADIDGVLQLATPLLSAGLSVKDAVSQAVHDWQQKAVASEGFREMPEKIIEHLRYCQHISAGRMAVSAIVADDYVGMAVAWFQAQPSCDLIEVIPSSVYGQIQEQRMLQRKTGKSGIEP